MPSTLTSTNLAATANGRPDHPLAALTAEEIVRAAGVVHAAGRLTDAARFASIVLHEPPKATVSSWRPGDPVDREVRCTIVPGPAAELVEAVVSVTKGELRSWTELADTRPAILFEEAITAIVAVQQHPEFVAALARRGITDVEQVQLDPWPSGTFGLAHEEGRRVTRCIPYFRERPTDNGYARPIEGLLVDVDLGRGEVLAVVDRGVVPMAPEAGAYRAEETTPHRADLKPLEITQPEGPSFTVAGNLLRWQRWSLRLAFDPYEGLVLNTVTYDDGGRSRRVLHRASIGEMVVPYGDPGPLHGWKNAFDAGEWGLGRLADSLTLGCDCLGAIHYFDVPMADERGGARVLERGICVHEEDYGILWKHVDMQAGTTEVRRSRRLVISSISTVGNYEYGFYWYLYLDGTIQLEVKLTGIMSTMGIVPGDQPRHATVVAPGLAAPVHQHLFCARLDLDVDGETNEVYEVDTTVLAPGPDNPWTNAFVAQQTPLRSEREAQRLVDPGRSRSWLVVNPHARNRLGQPVGYRLRPGATPTLLAGPDSPVGRRATFATRNLWVTPYDPDERRPAGDHPNQSQGGDGLPRWTSTNRSLVDADVVLWHTFGITHVPRPEDWPVTPVEYCGFHLVPFGFFDGNPALDVPPSEAHCTS